MLRGLDLSLETQPQRFYDFRAPLEKPKREREVTEPWRVEMRGKMDTDAAKKFVASASRPSSPSSASSSPSWASAAS
jgi:hypothetical protein